MSSPIVNRRNRTAAIFYTLPHSLALIGVRLSLVVAAAGIFALGFFRLPDTAMTQGEFVVGEVLAVAVGLQMLIAAVFFRSSSRETR